MDSVEISDKELQESPWMGCGAVAVGLLLKSKGVPMVGTFFPRMKPGITYTTHRDEINARTVIEWEEKQGG